jgi:chemotaxis protein methyltransferase CheR
VTWTESTFRAVTSVIHEDTGLIFPEYRRTELQQALERALPRDPDAEKLRRLLNSDGDAREALIAELTVGETYFLRDANQFALVRSLLPALAAARAPLPVRVWSAGCASGEEPYSVAIVAEQLGLGDRVTVVGTDLSRVRLAQARRGVYRTWSLRGVDPAVVDRFFEARGSTFHLRPQIRERVDFRYLNLAEDRFPSLTAGLWGMDLVLCRNVLIYFDRPTIERVARRLVDTLSEDGWLVLGASDPPIAEIIDVETKLTRHGLAYRRRHESRATGDVLAPATPDVDVVPIAPHGAPDAAVTGPISDAPPPEAPPFAAPAPPADAAPVSLPAPAATTSPTEAGATPADEMERAYALREYGRAEQLARAIVGHGPPSGPRPWIVLIRALANRGCLSEAAKAADTALEAQRDSAELLYLHAVLLAQTARHADAAAAARRALYLERDLIVAHVALGNARSRLGDASAAARAYRNAETLLARMPQDAAVPAADGQPVQRLRQIVRTQLTLLGNGA